MPKIRGPKDGKLITASFDGKKDSVPSLKTTKDLVLLSVRGNEFCEGEYLSAIVNQAVNMHQTAPEFTGPKGKTTFLIADEVYWHNLKELNFTPEDEVRLKKEALTIGETYLTTNLGAFLAPLGMTVETFKDNYPHKMSSVDDIIEVINQLAEEQGKNFEIVRWQTWVAQNNSVEKINTMMGLYESVEGLKESINKTKEDFVKRHAEEGKEDLWRLRSHDYLSEESPAVMWLAASLDYNFVIYPKEILPSFAATKEFFVVEKHVARISQGMSIKEECEHNDFCLHVDKPSRLVNWLAVNFTRSHAPKASVTSAQKSDSVRETNTKVENKTPENIQTFLENQSRSRNNTSFFPSRKPQKGQYDELSHEGDYMMCSYDQAGKISDILVGVTRGLTDWNEKRLYATITSTSSASNSTQLSDIFAGITRGVLETSLSSSEKIAFLANLIHSVTERNEITSEPRKMDSEEKYTRRM